MLAGGAIGWIAYNSETEGEEYVIAGYVTCVLILLFGVLGVLAAVRESVCLTATVGRCPQIQKQKQIFLYTIYFCLFAYRIPCDLRQSAVFLLLLAIAQIATTFLFLHPMEVKSGQKTVEIAWQANNMDGLQQNYECCGKTSAQDYVHLNQPIPPSCYADLKQSTDHLFLKGCIEEVQSQYDSDKRRFLIVSWVLVAFEVSIDWNW